MYLQDFTGTRKEISTRLYVLTALVAIVAYAFLATAALAGFVEGRAAYNAKDYAVAYEEFSTAADQGHVAAQYFLGHMHRRGRHVKRDYMEALRWYRKAADQGHARAQNWLGVMYGRGLGVKRDYAEALRWYHKAANQGDAMAKYNLGNYYKYGRGVAPNKVEAYKWFSLFAAQRPNDQRNWVLGEMEEYMTPMEVSEAKERAKNWQPASGN